MKNVQALVFIIAGLFCSAASSAKAQSWDFEYSLAFLHDFGFFQTYEDFQAPELEIAYLEVVLAKPLSLGNEIFMYNLEIDFESVNKSFVGPVQNLSQTVFVNQDGYLEGIFGNNLGSIGALDYLNLNLGEMMAFELFRRMGSPELPTDMGNVIIRGNFATPIPEPSSFAALAGGLVLGFSALRRRRKA